MINNNIFIAGIILNFILAAFVSNNNPRMNTDPSQGLSENQLKTDFKESTSLGKSQVFLIAEDILDEQVPQEKSDPNSAKKTKSKKAGKVDKQKPANKQSDESNFTSKKGGKSGTFIDVRDKRVYKWVKIENLIWMGENLNYETAQGSYCYDDILHNCFKYGRLYEFATASNACPRGWHLPSEVEFRILLTFSKGEGKKSNEELSKTEDESFSALMGGYRNRNGQFNEEDRSGNFWSTSRIEASSRIKYLTINPSQAYFMEGDTTSGLSVRCIKDLGKNSATKTPMTTNEDLSSGYFEDSRDGKTYKWLKIGDQTWMGENLNFETKTGSWINGKYNPRYYNWETAQDLCPNGWHLPTEDNFKKLLDNSGGEGPNAGKFLRKDEGDGGFNARTFGKRTKPNTNTSRFIFEGVNEDSYFWSTSLTALKIYLNQRKPEAKLIKGLEYEGFSVRCIKD